MSTTIVAGLLLLCCLLNGLAYAQSLPSAATPGGARPKLDDGITEPFVYPNTVLPKEPVPIEVPEDPNAPRMLVRGFRVRGVIEREELDITQRSIESLVHREAQALVAGEAAQGFTIAMFEKLTRAIGSYYRERGFFLARSYIPQQQVNEGIVNINIIEGELNQVVYKDNELYSDEQLDDLFEQLIGESVFLDDIERVIFIANDFPGLDASALFGPGLKPASAAIQVTADEVPHTGFVSWDNYGSTYTGEQRLRGNYTVHNLFGQADRIETNVLLTLDPQNSTYFDVFYEQPVLNYDYLAGGGVSLNTFDVGGNLEDLEINGESMIINGFMTYFYRRERDQRMTATVDLALKEAESLVIDTTDSLDKLTVLSGRLTYNGTSWSGGGAFQQVSLLLSLGLEDFLGSMDANGNEQSGRIGDSGDFAGGGFTKLNFDYLRIQSLTLLQNLVFKFSLQSSSDLLTSLEQVSLGGPDTVRAYPVAEALVDEAMIANIEWRARASQSTDLNFLNGLQYLVFLDYATGSLNQPLNNEISEVTLSGYGFGFEVQPYNTMRASLIFAFDLGDEPSDNQTLPFYFSLQYDYL